MQSSFSWKDVEVPVPLDKDILSSVPLSGVPRSKRMAFHGSFKIKLLSVVRRLSHGPLPLRERLLWLLVSLYVASL